MSSCRLNVPIPLTVEPAGQDISPASHAPFRGGAESRRQMREQRDLTSPQMPHGKTHCVSMQPPPQSGVLLFAKHNHLAPHSFTGYQPLISGCRVYGTTSNSHDNSPSSAAAVCREHFLIHMITAPHQRLPCVEDIFLIHMITAPHQRLPCVEDIFLIHMITAPHQRLPCVEDIF